MLSLKKIYQLITGASLQDAHEIPVSEGPGSGQVKKYSIAQLKAFIWAYVQTQITDITKGDTGAQGPQGNQGIQGEQGTQGLQGIQGVQGIKGDAGIQGDQGIQGPQGIKGDTGDQGIQGFQGVAGEKGDKGDQGDVGEGVEPGGFTGQVLRKKTDDQFDTYWDDLPYVNVLDFGAVGDGITDDTDAIAAAIAAGNTIYFPKTSNHYRCTIALRKSNMTFIMAAGVVLDGGVFHIEGIGPGTPDWNPGDPVQYRENIRVIGKLALTSRLGTYYAKNLFFDDIEIVADSSVYINQTAEGGSRGVHFYWGTENVFVNRMISRSTKSGESYGGLFIDANPAYITESKPRNFYINELSIPESNYNGIWLYKVENLQFGNVSVISPLYMGFYADGVENMSVGQLSISGSGESNIYYQNLNNLTIQNFTSNSPGDFDIQNISGTNVNIGYNQSLTFATDPFAQVGFSKLNISSYNDLKDKPIISGVLSDNLELGSGTYGVLKIKGTAGALIDYYKGSTLLGEMGMEEMDSTTSQYKFYTRSGGDTVNILTLLGDKILLKLVAEHADNAAAIVAGLPIDTVYRTGDSLKIVH